MLLFLMATSKYPLLTASAWCYIHGFCHVGWVIWGVIATPVIAINLAGDSSLAADGAKSLLTSTYLHAKGGGGGIY